MTYDTVKERIEQYIQKNYSQGIDLAESIREGNYETITKCLSQDDHRLPDSKVDEFMMKIEQDGLNLENQQELRDHSRRTEVFQQNRYKAFVYIYTNSAIEGCRIV